MKQHARLILLLALLGPLLGGCSLPVQNGPQSFDLLARRIPGDIPQAVFLNLKLEGQAGVYWQRIRDRLEANPEAQPLLDSLISQFYVQNVGLDPYVVGPVANWTVGSTQFYLVQINSQSAARDAILLQVNWNPEWKKEDYQGRTLYYATTRVDGQPTRLAFTVYDRLVLLAADYNTDSIDKLKMMVDLSEQDSLAAKPLWQTLYARLPPSPMGLIFMDVSTQTGQTQPSGTTISPGQSFGQQIQALALAAVPERNGMRVDIVSAIKLQDSALPETRDLLALPGVDPGFWAGLPANTAVVVSGHDASIIWPVLKDILGWSLNSASNEIGLDIEAGLFGTGGPLSADFCAVLLPPLPDQPISQGVPAGQLLFLGRDTSAAQMDTLQAALESQGVVLSPDEVQGLPVQTQVGTELTGYALSFGLNEQGMILATSPGAIEQSLIAQNAGNGLVQDVAFQAVVDALPRDPSFFVYLNRPSLTDIVRTNTTEKEYRQSQEMIALEVFDAIGLGLRLGTEAIDGTLYFLLQ